MMVSTPSIVLHGTKYSDTSLIVKLFTREHGVKSFIVKGAYSKKSRFRASLFSPLSILHVTYDDRHSDHLMYLRDVQRDISAAEQLYDPARSSLVMFYDELLYKLLTDAGEDKVLYDFLEGEILRIYEPDIDLVDLPLRFLLRLSIVLGFFPENNFSDTNRHFSLQESRFQPYCVDENNELPLEESLYLSHLLRQEGTVHVSRHIRNSLLHYLLRYYKVHNEQLRNIDSVEILASVLH
ncbi:MAG: DNA repair protein RecO [Bacteroidales bacterium]|nr:DNA repair protein RecO [Bacteroidales bacterium]